uniref:Putative secreted protein n=1 Tax=Rhipicephalus microplus TaxID=6941 RepID=A0A6M2DDE5_RHIMP
MSGSVTKQSFSVFCSSLLFLVVSVTGYFLPHWLRQTFPLNINEMLFALSSLNMLSAKFVSSNCFCVLLPQGTNSNYVLLSPP